MKRFLSWLVLLCLLLPNSGLAAMTGNPSMDRIEPRNTSLYAVYDGDTGCMYFCIPGKYGFCHIYQYHRHRLEAAAEFRITENAQYVIWYHAPKGRQMVHVLDVYAS